MTRPRSLKNIAGLKAEGLVAAEDVSALEVLASAHAVGVNSHVLNAVHNKAQPLLDPVGRQYIPSVEELDVQAEELFDPIGDDAHSPVEGLVHRYPDRVLLKVSNICAVYCRYCFRREMVGGTEGAFLEDSALEAAFSYIEAHPEIWEVILSGGDPLVLSPRRLENILRRLENIPHVQIIRIHSRVPVADPGRIDDTICSVLKNVDKPVYAVVHINHPQEITDHVRECLDFLLKSGCTLLSQSVLLKGVNNDTSVLENLFRSLISLRVKPYYLHHPDLAKGTNHFRISIEEGQSLMRSLQGRLSGICLPTYVLDIPGGYGKVPIGPGLVQPLEDGFYSVEDFKGCQHVYPPRSEDDV
ncbi:MAG: lysine-2,3-aminomutase-like protein [Alphaproteobacteria bacterium]|nr:lysine-2,3-aminomutase-like protein [Alphaproteobacteria bacterium]